jgi:hypothetical protein
MLTPNEALLRRVQAAETSRKAARLFGHKVGEPARDMGKVEIDMLSTAALYLWRADLLAAMVSASKDLPAPVTLTKELVPTESGLYLFEQAIAVEGASRPPIAAGWHTISDELLCVWLFAEPWMADQPGPFVSSASFILQCGVDVLTAQAGDWRRIEAAKESFDLRVGGAAAVRLLTASWLWLKQRVMTEHPAPVAGFARKQAERAEVDSTVRVIVLRRAADHPHAPQDPEAQAWSCQWLVRGHWRQQFYPATNAHHPLWIEPHVKGPTDKPFKPPTETVFKVER